MGGGDRVTVVTVSCADDASDPAYSRHGVGTRVPVTSGVVAVLESQGRESGGDRAERDDGTASGKVT